jgi:succinate dehydrogenase/fumarate reductase cytochrome b subunit
MPPLQIFYSLAIGIGFGGLAFAATYHLLWAIRTAVLRRRGILVTHNHHPATTP